MPQIERLTKEEYKQLEQSPDWPLFRRMILVDLADQVKRLRAIATPQDDGKRSVEYQNGLMDGLERALRLPGLRATTAGKEKPAAQGKARGG